jgi:hypothetical protein
MVASRAVYSPVAPSDNPDAVWRGVATGSVSVTCPVAEATMPDTVRAVVATAAAAEATIRKSASVLDTIFLRSDASAAPLKTLINPPVIETR